MELFTLPWKPLKIFYCSKFVVTNINVYIVKNCSLLFVLKIGAACVFLLLILLSLSMRQLYY